MYQDSPEELHKIDYCNEIQGFINYAIFNPRNISEDGIRCLYKRCKNKKFLKPIVITMHLLYKWFMEKYLCLFIYGESGVPHKTIIERLLVLVYI
jgi:hypothetical protein